MSHDLTPASVRKIDWVLVLVISTGLHMILVCGLLLAWGGTLPPTLALLRVLRMQAIADAGVELSVRPVRAAMDADEVEYEMEETKEDVLEDIVYDELNVYEQDVVADQPGGGEAGVTDSDLPFQESFGVSHGFGDSHFEGPSDNATVGIGGGAGGAFMGRGGGRSLGSGAGGRRATRVKQRSWKRSPLTHHSLRLTVGKDRVLPLKGVHASVRVDGFRARVVLDCYFKNDTQQTLDGTFQVRLPDGASPHFLAFGEMRLSRPLQAAHGKAALSVDIDTLMRERDVTWNRPREARMVPRQRAAHAYKEVVRRTSNPDPALLEWAGAGVFHTRVFPLTPSQLHRIVLAYDVDLVEEGQTLAYRLDLPTDVPELLVDLEVRGATASVSPAARAHQGRYRWWNPAERSFTVRVPRLARQMIRGTDDSGDYFAIRVEPDVPGEARPGARAEGERRAVFMLDTSLSSGPDAYPIWLALLESILVQGRGSIDEFALMAFDIQSSWHKPSFVANTAENVQAALRWARTRTLEGATDLSQALTTASHREGGYDVFLLSDGRASWGEHDEREVVAALGNQHTLFAYRTGLGGADHALLDRLAARTRGGVFAVTRPEDVAVAARAHTHRPWRLESTAVAGGRDLLVAGAPTWIYPGQVLHLVARGRPTASDHVRLSLRRGNTQRLVRFAVPDIVESDLAPRAYGEVAVGGLEEVSGVGFGDRTAYATQFRVVGKSCSLLMLESEAEYKNFGFTQVDHAAHVRETSVARLLASAADATQASTSQASLLTWIDGLGARHQNAIKLPAGLRVAAGALPSEIFRTAPETLDCKALEHTSSTAAWRRRLSVRALPAAAVRAEARRRSASADDALRVLSTRVEHDAGDLSVLRETAEAAVSLGFGGHAWHLWRRVVDRRPLEAHGYARMGRALAVAGKSEAAILCYEAALGQATPQRRGAFRRCTLFEYVDILARIERGAVRCRLKTFALERLGTLSLELGIHRADLVVVLGWNTDRTDVDLHLRDPQGEHCFYKNRKTAMGGRLSTDVTQGYGPEVFVLPRAKAGVYRIGAKYFRSDQRRHGDAVVVNLVIYRGWGRPGATVERRSVVLDKVGVELPILQLRLGGDG